jgi:hypothetical protein
MAYSLLRVHPFPQKSFSAVTNRRFFGNAKKRKASISSTIADLSEIQKLIFRFLKTITDSMKLATCNYVYDVLCCQKFQMAVFKLEEFSILLTSSPVAVVPLGSATLKFSNR